MICFASSREKKKKEKKNQAFLEILKFQILTQPSILTLLFSFRLNRDESRRSLVFSPRKNKYEFPLVPFQKIFTFHLEDCTPRTRVNNIETRERRALKTLLTNFLGRYIFSKNIKNMSSKGILSVVL